MPDTDAADELVHFDVVDAVATITLDSPANRNALSTRLVHDLTTALDRAEAGAVDGSLRHSAPVPTSRSDAPGHPTRARSCRSSSG